jgi:DNA ligase (NAD+)
VQSKNLADAITISRTKPVEDWRFLAAFGIADLGTGDSRKLLAHVPLENVLELDRAAIAQIKGFGEKTSQSIVESVGAMTGTIRHMLDLGFNLQRTPLASAQKAIDSPIAGKNIVFTGKMIRGSRETMQAEARALGAKVQTAVSGNTDYLVCGENVGASKMDKANRLGVTILTESRYLAMITGK